jgi:hypothetical protein
LRSDQVAGAIPEQPATQTADEPSRIKAGKSDTTEADKAGTVKPKQSIYEKADQPAVVETGKSATNKADRSTITEEDLPPE